MNRLVLALAALCTLALPAVASAQQAPAGTYNFNYSTLDNSFFGNGTLTLNDAGVIQTITGTANGDTILGTSSYASADNTLFQTVNGIAPDFNGFAFSTLATNFSIGDIGTGELGITNSTSNPGGYCCGTHPLTLNIAAVPEPATWAMMLVGFGAIGFQMRRKRPALIPQLA